MLINLKTHQLSAVSSVDQELNKRKKVISNWLKTDIFMIRKNKQILFEIVYQLFA